MVPRVHSGRAEVRFVLKLLETELTVSAAACK